MRKKLALWTIITTILATTVNAQTALNYTHLTTSFTDVEIFGYNWIIPTLILIITLVLITRDYKMWASLGLPMMVLLHTIGLRMHPLIFLTIGIIYAIDLISIRLIGATIEGVSEYTVDITKRIKEYRKEPPDITGKRLFSKKDIIKHPQNIYYEGSSIYQEPHKIRRKFHKSRKDLKWREEELKGGEL